MSLTYRILSFDGDLATKLRSHELLLGVASLAKLVIGHPEGDVDRGHEGPGGIEMAELVIEEDVGAKLAHDTALVDAAEEEDLVDAEAPGAQGADHPLMGRRGPGGDDGATIVSGWLKSWLDSSSIELKAG